MKDLLFRCLRHEDIERAPWVPFAGVHAASLKGYTATEMLTDADKAVESLLEVNRLTALRPFPRIRWRPMTRKSLP